MNYERGAIRSFSVAKPSWHDEEDCHITKMDKFIGLKRYLEQVFSYTWPSEKEPSVREANVHADHSSDTCGSTGGWCRCMRQGNEDYKHAKATKIEAHGAIIEKPSSHKLSK